MLNAWAGVNGAGRVPAARAPYLERPDLPDNALDAALLNVWGRVAPYTLSRLERARFERLADQVEGYEQQLITMSKDTFRRTVDELRSRLAKSERRAHDVALAFALAREAARRYAGMRHFRVQLIGGAALMDGALAEMQTGEGKTLTALLPAVAAALAGRPVHVITVNDYLARRDAEQLRPVYGALGLSVGLVQHGQGLRERQLAYGADVTYCTNKELVFDYLRDRLVLGTSRTQTGLLVEGLVTNSPARRSQRLLLRGLHVAIVDEADSVLIDEARTPLILSSGQDGVANDSTTDSTTYEVALDMAGQLVSGEDFHLLASEKRVRLTRQGEHRIAELASGLQEPWTIRKAREDLMQQALCALHIYQRDVQYIVVDGKVQIVDEFTGRVMPDRSWERGIHQLIEVKENCAVTQRRQTLARITFQRFFRRYAHLCGMTGTAVEAAGELYAVYGLRVVRIPTNRPLRRTSVGTRIYVSEDVKWEAVLDSVTHAMRRNRSVLIGTRSVGASERVDNLLRQAGLSPVILNARQDRYEAEIIASAGQPGRVTVATNMAGRGTDITIHQRVRDEGGLHVILTEYHESRRIDRQLFGRAGRQGDPGTYESIVSLDDELFQRFAGKALLRLLAKIFRKTGEVPVGIGFLLRSLCQIFAERIHARTRRVNLADDYRFRALLGFAGSE
jgi:preprotein translocase subunit SecA